MKITVATIINASLDSVWTAWTTPADIIQWNFASNDWTCPSAKIDLRVAGSFNYRMAAKDGSMGFDFSGTFTSIIERQQIEYALEDNRKVLITFAPVEQGISLVESFEAEDEHAGEQQKQGWQCILNNFKQYVESK